MLRSEIQRGEGQSTSMTSAQSTHLTCEMGSSSFEQAGCALAAADAHRHDAVALVTARELAEQVTRKARARHSVGMTDGDRAAVDVELLGVEAELVTAIHGLRRERLVELDQIDVVLLDAGELQEL